MLYDDCVPDTLRGRLEYNVHGGCCGGCETARCMMTSVLGALRERLECDVAVVVWLQQ